MYRPLRQLPPNSSQRRQGWFWAYSVIWLAVTTFVVIVFVNVAGRDEGNHYEGLGTRAADYVAATMAAMPTQTPYVVESTPVPTSIAQPIRLPRKYIGTDREITAQHNPLAIGWAAPENTYEYPHCLQYNTC